MLRAWTLPSSRNPPWRGGLVSCASSVSGMYCIPVAFTPDEMSHPTQAMTATVTRIRRRVVRFMDRLALVWVKCVRESHSLWQKEESSQAGTAACYLGSTRQGLDYAI